MQSNESIGIRCDLPVMKHTFWVGILWFVQIGLFALDILTGPDPSLLGYFLFPSLIAATFAPPRQVILLASTAVAAGFAIGWHYGWLLTPAYIVRLGALALTAALAVVVDFVRVRQAEATLRERARVQATLDSLIDPHVLLRALRDKSGQITDFIFADANDAACQYNRIPRDRMIGHRLLELLPSHVASGLLDLYRGAVQSGVPLHLDDYLYPHEILAEPRYYDIRAVKVGDALSCTWRDVTERHKAAMAFEQRARTDELTQLLTRREVFDRLEDLRGKIPRSGRDIAVLFVDFDRFKNINDLYGHAMGDQVLRTIAERIRSCLRHTDDLGARIGGDEMMVVLHGVHGIGDALKVAEKIRSFAAEPVHFNGQSIEATVSVGVALTRQGESTTDLVARADAAMYQAKQRGRNQVITVDGPTAS